MKAKEITDTQRINFLEDHKCLLDASKSGQENNNVSVHAYCGHIATAHDSVRKAIDAAMRLSK